MRKFQKGDVVLCKKFEIKQKLCIYPDRTSFEPYIDDTYFNRKAYISKTYKEHMDKALGVLHEDRDEYEITFLDTGNTLAWLSGEDLILLLRRSGRRFGMCEYCQEHRTEKELYSDDVNYWFMRKMSGKWYMFYRHKDLSGSRGIQINNCPMCGRKLED